MKDLMQRNPRVQALQKTPTIVLDDEEVEEDKKTSFGNLQPEWQPVVEVKSGPGQDWELGPQVSS